MNKQEILTVLEDLYKITGFRISLHDKDYREIAAFPEKMNNFCAKINSDESEHKKCVECDRAACLTALKNRETYIYSCRYGLTEAVSPLYTFGALTGFLMMGQVALREEDKATARLLASRVLSDEECRRTLPDVQVINREMIDSYVRIMTVCAEYLTLSNAVMSSKPTVAQQAKKYVNDNIEKKFTIADLCRHLDCSKSTLLTGFKRAFGTTVNSYITEKRLERALALLSDTKKSISDVSYECGFTDQSYFSKVFSKQFGVPPSEYRSRIPQEKI